MLIGRENILQPGIESYSKQLIFYLYHYLDMIDIKNNDKKAQEKAKIMLKWLVFPNDIEAKKDLDKIKDDIGQKTLYQFKDYTKCIMLLLGKLAECVIIDRCINNRNTNIVCMNIATFQENIYEEYSNIEYDNYLAFSPSFRYIFDYDADGFLIRYFAPGSYNPHHTSKDIGWCKKDNPISQLKAELKEVNYLENAKLQIKTTLNCKGLDISSDYRLTPIICFDLDEKCDLLKEKNPKHNIFSARDVDSEMFEEIEKYFKILTAYALGMIDTIEISEKDVEKNMTLASLFRTSSRYIILSKLKKEYKFLDTTPVIEMIKECKKPVELWL